MGLAYCPSVCEHFLSVLYLEYTLDYFYDTSLYVAKVTTMHMRDKETLHFFNGKHIGYCIRKRQLSFESTRNAYEFNKAVFERITS